MTVETSKLVINTRGNCDVIDITNLLADVVVCSSIESGVVVAFCPSSTSALTTIENEKGCIEDLKSFYNQILPMDRDYKHNLRWGDGNGASHQRAALLGPSISIPFHIKKMILGTWQQVVLIDFDIRPRKREIILQIIG